VSRKDYNLIAATMAASAPPDMAGDDIAAAQWARDCASLANALWCENDRFDRARFLKACGAQP